MRCASRLRQSDHLTGILRTSADGIVRRNRNQLSVIRGRAWIEADHSWPLPLQVRTIGGRVASDGCPVTLIGDFSSLDGKIAATGIIWPHPAVMVLGDPELVLDASLRKTTKAAAVAIVSFCVAATFSLYLIAS